MKSFKLSSEQIRPIAPDRGSCIASDYITVNGEPVRFMYREQPRDPSDSGWRFFSGLEDEAYANNPDNFEPYDVNTIANYDRSIVKHLDAPTGSVFEKPGKDNKFVPVTDWSPPDS